MGSYHKFFKQAFIILKYSNIRKKVVGFIMRRADKEIIDKKVIEAIIQESDYCMISISDNNSPYMVPMNFGYKDNNLYLHSSSEGRKIEILKANNQVSFGV